MWVRFSTLIPDREEDSVGSILSLCVCMCVKLLCANGSVILSPWLTGAKGCYWGHGQGLVWHGQSPIGAALLEARREVWRPDVHV